MKRRLMVAVAGALLALGLTACDPNSPVGPNPPTSGTVVRHDRNIHEGVVYYYMYVRGPYGGAWVAVNWYDYLTCQRYDHWTQALGC